jgi:hypothetical protein
MAALGLTWVGTGAGAATPTPGLRSAHQIAQDEAFVAKKYGNCAAFIAPPHHCTFAVATTSNRASGHLYGIELVQQSMDDCYRGIVYVFNGTSYVTNTRLLPPHSYGGVKAIRADGPGAFSVVYWVNKNAQTACALGGDGGTDTYVYRWTGSHMVKKSGHLPRPPRVILGTS